MGNFSECAGTEYRSPCAGLGITVALSPCPPLAECRLPLSTQSGRHSPMQIRATRSGPNSGRPAFGNIAGGAAVAAAAWLASSSWKCVRLRRHLGHGRSVPNLHRGAEYHLRRMAVLLRVREDRDGHDPADHRRHESRRRGLPRTRRDVSVILQCCLGSVPAVDALIKPGAMT